MTKALSLPGLTLRILFGVAGEPSVSYRALRERYQGVLAKGATAGRFAPRTIEPPGDHAAWQRALVEECSQGVACLRATAGGWSEHALDRYRLPHPLLGKLTLREMLFFTLYHYTHHQANVVKKLSASTCKVDRPSVFPVEGGETSSLFRR